MESTSLRVPENFFYPYLNGWNGLRVQKGFRAQLPVAAEIRLIWRLHPEGREILKPNHICHRKPILTFYILFFLGQVQCQIIKNTNKIQNKNDGRRRFGWSRLKNKRNPTQ